MFRFMKKKRPSSTFSSQDEEILELLRGMRQEAAQLQSELEVFQQHLAETFSEPRAAQCEFKNGVLRISYA